MIAAGVRNSEPPRPLRRSRRLENIRKSAVADLEKDQECLQEPQKASQRKRKRAQEVDGRPDPDRADEPRKRTRVSTSTACVEANSQPAAASPQGERDQDPIKYWSQHGRWPRDYFEEACNMSNILARKRSRPSLSRKGSDVGSDVSSGGTEYNTPSDQKPREAKSADYKHQRYEILLSTKGSFMKESDMEITTKSQRECQNLLNSDAGIPRESLFRDDIFKFTCQKIQNRNESRVLQDVTRLIVPSAETLATYGATELDCLIESVNEGWNDSIPVTKTRSQPDYAVGFRREAFTEDQLKRLVPFVGDVTDSRNESYFMATYYMYFPFLTCEVKCGAAALDIADRQNAHSMTLAVRAIVELFRYVGREKELDREILAFSISHDYCAVRIYGHYAVIEGKKQTYYRHPIHKFDFTALDGKEKWTAYKFTKNVYELWMPKHFERICSAISDFPSNVSFNLSQQSQLSFTEQSGLSQGFGAQSLAQSSTSSTSAQVQADDQSNVAEAADITPNTSMNEANDGGRFKRPKEDGRRTRR